MLNKWIELQVKIKEEITLNDISKQVILNILININA